MVKPKSAEQSSRPVRKNPESSAGNNVSYLSIREEVDMRAYRQCVRRNRTRDPGTQHSLECPQDTIDTREVHYGFDKRGELKRSESIRQREYKSSIRR